MFENWEQTGSRARTEWQAYLRTELGAGLGPYLRTELGAGLGPPHGLPAGRAGSRARTRQQVVLWSRTGSRARTRKVSHYLGTRLGAGLGPNSLVPVIMGSLARTRCTFNGEHCSNPDVPVVGGGVAWLGADRWPGAVFRRYRGAWLGPWQIEKNNQNCGESVWGAWLDPIHFLFQKFRVDYRELGSDLR
jgi:hypothetical protein